LVDIGAALLDFTLTNATLTTFTKAKIVQFGWTFTRNFANMFLP